MRMNEKSAATAALFFHGRKTGATANMTIFIALTHVCPGIVTRRF